MIRIYVDIDGVLANWTDYILGRHFSKNSDIEWLNKHPNRGDLIRRAYIREPHLFNHLPVLPQAEQLIFKLEQLTHGHPCTIKYLTAVGGDHPNPIIAKKDKYLWLGRNFDIPEKDIIVVNRSQDKYHHADPYSILIDDFDDNIVEWVQAGGHGVLVEQNTYNAKLTYKQTAKKFYQLLLTLNQYHKETFCG